MSAVRAVSHTDAAIPPAKRISVAETGTHRERLARERWEDGSRPSAPANRFVAPDAKRRQLIFDSFTKLKLQQGAPPPPAGFSQDRGHEQKRADQQAAMDAAHGPKGTLLYTWGAGYHGQLGLATNRKKCRVEPAWIDFKEPVLQVACGGFHTAVLTDQGRMFTWGDGRMGQLGNLARKHNMMSTPHLVDFFTTNKIAIKHISCGQYHTAAVSSLGTMYTWGSAKFNQLGHGTRLDERYPRQVMVDKESVGKFLMASCGDRHTAAVSESRHVYTWGSGPHGQLGHGNGIDCQHPTRVQALDNVSIKTLSCGSTTTAAVAETGELYLWGFGENIHPKDSPNIIETPRLVAMPESVKQVAVGQSHVLALTDSGDVYAFGNGSMMQLGHGAKTNVRAPRLVLRGKNIHEVAAGRYHSMAVAGSGVLYTWGCGESGQLAHGTLDGEALPRLVLPLLANVVGQIACGEHHSFALASIEHSTIHPDIIQWKRIEDEELKLKREMVRDYPAGLSTRQVLDIEKKRDEIANRIEEEMRREQDNEGKHLKEQVGSIRSRDDLLVEVVDDMFEYDDDENEPLALEHKRTYVLSPGRAAREASAAAGGDGEPSNDETTPDGTQPSMSASASLPVIGTREMPAPQSGGSESAADVLAFFASMEATQKKPLPKPATLAPLPPRHSSAGVGHMTSHGGASAPMMFGSPMEPPSGLSIRADAQGDGVSPLQSPMPDPGAGLGVVPPSLTPSPHPAKKKGGLRVQNFHSLSSPSLALRQGAARPLTSLDVRRGGALTVPGQDADLTSDAGSSMPGTTTASLINSQGGYMRGSASGASLQGRSGAASAKPARLRGLSTALVLGGAGKSSSRSMASLDSTTGEPRQRASTSLDTAMALSAEPPPFQPMQPRLAFIEKASVALKKIKTSLQGEQKEQHPSQVIKSLFQKKKDYNALKAKCKEMKADYEGLKLRVSMEKPTTLDDANTFNAQEERIRELRMKLVTLNTRLMEAEENKRNYELYIIRMKEEDLQLSKQIDHVRGLVQEYERLLAKMDRINGRVIGQKGDIDVEIVRFHREIREFSDFAGEQLDKYHRLLKQSSHTISVAEKAVATRGFQLDEKQRVNMEKLTLVAEGNAEEERDIKEELSSWQDKVAYYEKRFHKITAATGLARPEDIVNKFFFNDEITRDLQADINAKKTTLARLKETKENCGKELEEEKGQFTTTKWKDVDHLSSNVRNQSKKTVRERTDLDRLLEKLAFVQEGVVSLLGTVESKIGDASQQQLAATIAVGSGSSAASSLTIPRSATVTSTGVFPTSSPTSPRHIADVELAAQPIILTPQGGGSLTDVSGGRGADLRIQVEVDPPVAKLETRLQALMVLIESAKRDLSLRESAESERRRRADDERKAHELQQSVLLKMAAERTMAGVASFG